MSRDLVHAFKNHLGIVAGFCELLLVELPADSPARHDILEIQKANRTALDLLPELARRLAEAAPSDTSSDPSGANEA